MARIYRSLLAGVLLLAWDAGAARAALMEPLPSADGPHVPAPGMFLVASRSFRDPFFSGSVIYLLQHDEQTTLGVIVNHPATDRLGYWLPVLEGSALGELTLYDGGPVYPDLMTVLIESRDWRPGTDDVVVRRVAGAVYASLDPAVFGLLQQDDVLPGMRVRCYFGHAGWSPGQLEYEIGRNYWHLVPGDPGEVFGDDAGSLWQRLIERLEPVEPVLPPTLSLQQGSSVAR